jgi:hypothetical protein
MGDVNQDSLSLASSMSNADVVTGVFGGLSKNIPVPQLLSGLINKQTGTAYTLQLNDAGCLIEVENASANSITVPPDSSVNFRLGTQIAVGQAGAGLTSVVAGSGVTVHNAGALSGQWSQGFLYKRGANEWVFVAGGAVSSGGGGGSIPTLNTPTLSAGTPTSTTIPLSWTDPNSTPNESNFEIQRSNDGSTAWTTINSPVANATSYTDTGLATGVTRYYRIRAVGDGVSSLTSGWSSIVNATTGSGSSAVNILLAANYGYTNSSQVFTVTGGGTAWGNSGVDDKYLPSGVDCRVYMKYVDSTTVDGFLGIHDINMGAQFPEIRACFRFTGGILETREAGSATNRGSVTAGVWYGLF